MKANHKNTLIKNNGDTRDIATAVMSVYNSDYMQVNELAQTLQDDTVNDTCENVFNYLIDHVQYKEDPSGVQWVKTPARLLADGTGDCKSMAIFIASCLRCLNIDHVFRFVSFNKRKEATHVYVVVNAGKPDEIILDAVVRVFGMPKFNHEEQFTYKSDMNGTTIYKMSGIPTVGADNTPDENIDRYSVWIGNEGENNITPGKAFLYSRFDLILEMLNMEENSVKLAALFDQLDITASLLHAYNHVSGDTEQFQNISFIICGMVADGSFVSKITDENLRADRLDGLFSEIDQKFEAGYLPAKYDVVTWQMLNVEVFPYNELVNTGSSIGAFWPWEIIADKIKAGGYYFLYTYIPDNDLKNYPASVAKKRASQNQVKKWMVIDLFHTNATRENLIRSGIIARTGLTPEAYIAKCKRENIKIGVLSETLVVISTIIGILIGLIALIRAIWPPKDSPTNEDITNGTANVTDELFTTKPKAGTDTATGTTTSSLATYALPLALAASFIISKFKN